MREVYSIERIAVLSCEAGATLSSLGYGNAHLRIGDGAAGWAAAAPFDAICVTAAAPDVLPAWQAQLAPGGRLVVPVGEPAGMQTLRLITKDADGQLTQRDVLPVRFVPLLRETDVS